MTRTRLKAVICPSCRGTGKHHDWDCMWCRGDKRVPVETALQWADTSEMLGRGGYIAGDHDIDDMHRMVKDANAVRDLVSSPKETKNGL